MSKKSKKQEKLKQQEEQEEQQEEQEQQQENQKQCESQKSKEQMLAEAALFMASEPLGINELTKVMKTESFGIALKELERLIETFNKNDSALEIIKTNEGKYQMCVRDAYAASVSHLAVDTEFSRAVLRTLGLIAVKQPVKQSIVVRIIGNKAYGYIKELGEKGLIHAKKQANTKILSTSSKFESYFGKRADEIKSMG